MCRGNTQTDDQVVPGLATYSIPGIAFVVQSTVGPLQFSPLFTSRRTAELTWVRSFPASHCSTFQSVILHLHWGRPGSRGVQWGLADLLAGMTVTASG